MKSTFGRTFSTLAVMLLATLLLIGIVVIEHHSGEKKNGGKYCRQTDPDITLHSGTSI